MPIHRRLPKRGFTNIFKKQYAIVNIRDLKIFESGTVVDEAALVAAGLIGGKRSGIKLLGHGDIQVPLTVKVSKASQQATEKIVAAGGQVEVE
jgi:large subunit ribosomal protein L15